MTFVIGFRCCDGIVLCTDSLEADGVTKRYVNKTKIIGTSDWSVAIAGAGPGGFIDKFTSDVSANLPRGAYNRKEIETTIEETLSRFRSQYEEPFRILAGVQCTRAIDSALYRSDDNYLVPIKDHAHIGMGHSLWRFFAENLYVSGNSVEDNILLATFILTQALEYVDGVDGDIQLVTYTFGDQSWKPKIAHSYMNMVWSPDWRVGTIKNALNNWWSLSRPPSRSEQVAKFGGVRTPGDELTFLNGVGIEKLQTVSGRNKNEGSLYGNRDRLRKRALLEQERAQSEEKPNP
jgi:20S proteasome alpha/beta subunit